jgi:GDP-L-fucose synthase
MVGKVVGYDGEIVFDITRPDGTPQKLLDVGKLAAMGWRARTALEHGLARAYQDFLRSRQGETRPGSDARGN